MQIEEQTSGQYFTNLTILYGSLIAGQVLFAAVAYFMKPEAATAETEAMHETFQMIIPLVAIGCLAGSMLLFRSRVAAIQKETDLKKKMADYRAASIMRYALLEAPSLFSLVVYLLTGRPFYLGLAAIFILAFLLYRPTPQRAAVDLTLSPGERAKLENPQAVIT